MTLHEGQLNLHDATFVSVTVDWVAGTASLVFRVAGGFNSVVSATDVSRLIVPREQPWGRSVSVNTAALFVTDDGRTRLKLEMQSGDEIVVEASSLAVSRAT